MFVEWFRKMRQVHMYGSVEMREDHDNCQCWPAHPLLLVNVHLL